MGHRLGMTEPWDIVPRHRRAESARSDRHQSVEKKHPVVTKHPVGERRVMSAGKRMGWEEDGMRLRLRSGRLNRGLSKRWTV